MKLRIAEGYAGEFDEEPEVLEAKAVDAAREAVYQLLKGYRSHDNMPKVGDMVRNTNPGCIHYRSEGKVTALNDVGKGRGTSIKYRCTNDGPKWSVGDYLEKTPDQLSPLKLRKGDAKKTPAEPHERKTGSSTNKKGSASTGSGSIQLSESTIQTLKNKVKEHNESSEKTVTLGQLKAVYRRGSGAFSTSHHPKANRHSWSMGRVNSFLRRVKGGDGHSQDDDLIKAYTVPEAVRNAARRGLELRRKQPKSGKAGLDPKEASRQGIGSGVARARDLMGGSVSEETVKRMHAYFSRHASNYKLDAGKKPHEDKGYVAGLLWGGEAGRAWAARTVEKIKREETKKGSSCGHEDCSHDLLTKAQDARRGGQVDALDTISGMMSDLYAERLELLKRDLEKAVRERD